jgi:hypothetical protein
MNQNGPDISEDVLQIIRANEYGRFRSVLRVVSYIVDGGRKAPRIEKRQYTHQEAGGWSERGKMQSLDFGDVEAIVKGWPEIKAHWSGR